MTTPDQEPKNNTMEESPHVWEEVHHYDESTKLDVYGRVRRSADAPLAVIMGWLGSKEHHLRKYASMYQEMGYNVVWSSAPTSILFPTTQGRRIQYVVALCNYIETFISGGVVLAPFSNGGALLVRELWESSEEVAQKVASKVSATCYDSCPGYMGPLTGARAVLSSDHNNNTSLVKWASVHCWNLYVNGRTVLTTGSLDGGFWKAMNNLWFGKDDYGELVVYSDDDHLCDADKIREFVNARPKKPHVLHFHKCGHCLHGLKFPRAYASALQQLHEDFVNPWRSKHGFNAVEVHRRAFL